MILVCWVVFFSKGAFVKRIYGEFGWPLRLPAYSENDLQAAW